MSSVEIFRVIALCQGAFILGMFAFCLAYYYSIRENRNLYLSFHVVALVISYVLVVFASLRTLWSAPYPANDPWYWLAGLGYFFGDVFLMLSFQKIRLEAKLNNKKKNYDTNRKSRKT